MEKIVEGLLKNAIENTPDQGRVAVVVRTGDQGPVFEVQDSGVGVTAEKQRLIFNHYFATGDTMSYASKAPYDFNAGGKGVDLLRITIFSERYRFDTKMISRSVSLYSQGQRSLPGRCPPMRPLRQSGGLRRIGGHHHADAISAIEPDDPGVPRGGYRNINAPLPHAG
jgi:hypothetical protein